MTMMMTLLMADDYNDDVADGRYDEGLQDITAASIQMVGEPREVFNNLLKGHGTTR